MADGSTIHIYIPSRIIRLECELLQGSTAPVSGLIMSELKVSLPWKVIASRRQRKFYTGLKTTSLADLGSREKQNTQREINSHITHTPFNRVKLLVLPGLSPSFSEEYINSFAEAQYRHKISLDRLLPSCSTSITRPGDNCLLFTACNQII